MAALGPLAEARTAEHPAMTFAHHAEAIAGIPGKRRVSYGMPMIVGGERLWRTFSDIDTAEEALPYERVLGEEEDYVEHVTRSALTAGAGRSGPSQGWYGPPVRHAGPGRARDRPDRAELRLRGPRRAVSDREFHPPLRFSLYIGHFMIRLGLYPSPTTRRGVLYPRLRKRRF